MVLNLEDIIVFLLLWAQMFQEILGTRCGPFAKNFEGTRPETLPLTSQLHCILCRYWQYKNFKQSIGIDATGTI